MWVNATRAKDNVPERVNLKSVDRMWTHVNDKDERFTVCQFRAGDVISYLEPMSHFIPQTPAQVEWSWPDENISS